MPKTELRTKSLLIPLNETEFNRLRELAKAQGVPMAAVCRRPIYESLAADKAE